MQARKDDVPISRPPRTPDHFRLAGPTVRLDPRTAAVRKDVADIALAGQVFAPHYARPLDHGCSVAAVPIRAAPSADAVAVSELLHGETFAVVDCSGGWAWGYGRHDGYTGYVPLDALGPVVSPTHVVDQPAALLFRKPSIKAPVALRLPLGARLAAEPAEGSFLRTADGFVHRRHIHSVEEPEQDFVEVAARFTGTPYRWGGRSGDGIDCSGLVQTALALSGIAAPRDSDQQAEALGEALPADSPLRRGDLLFWPGHVGIMADDAHLLHANAYWMRVVTEPLAEMLARLPNETRQPLIRRLK